MFDSFKRIVEHEGVGGALSASLSLAGLVANRDLLGRRFVQRQIFDYRMWLDARDQGISRTLILFGEREMEHRVLLK